MHLETLRVWFNRSGASIQNENYPVLGFFNQAFHQDAFSGRYVGIDDFPTWLDRSPGIINRTSEGTATGQLSIGCDIDNLVILQRGLCGVTQGLDTSDGQRCTRFQSTTDGDFGANSPMQLF